jgi:stage V sporulation protein R
MFINSFVDQEFVTKNKLFVSGSRLSKEKTAWEYYIKSRKADDYRQMLKDSLYHPPHIEVDEQKTKDRHLYLVHRFEGRPLVREYIPNTMLGIEYLWGGPVSLETTEGVVEKSGSGEEETPKSTVKWQRVVYTMENRKISKTEIQSS